MREIRSDAEREQWIDACGVRSILPARAAAQLKLCAFQKGEALCREGDRARFLYFLLQGRCRVVRLLQTGRQCLLRFFQPFAVLGDFEFAEGGAVRTDVEAADDLLCLCLPMAQREQLLADPVFLRFLCAALCHKAILRDRDLADAISFSVTRRAASYILAGAREGEFHDNHTHMAEFLGCSHRQLLRVLGQLCGQGALCRLDGGGYRVANAALLSSLSAGVYAAEPFTYPGLGLHRPDTTAETKG
ncbi:cyclic nucleotide-binding domain-containing protein [Anaerofilum sp. BX8]|uniref:Cyclic nucleotide-binding domain-containing protein n=1 Tax=Anaerofilum hominis TaxID=2763016 RepID=A0A923IDS6_9FIRM|nr:cyclic nucleotide-binding domain-containing protein [Anaerofilum hominis]MBC5580547.1 cyclic nucleotide-binding domain-containing protein [Anaerofilum hominis]